MSIYYFLNQSLILFKFVDYHVSFVLSSPVCSGSGILDVPLPYQQVINLSRWECERPMQKRKDEGDATELTNDSEGLHTGASNGRERVCQRLKGEEVRENEMI